MAKKRKKVLLYPITEDAQSWSQCVDVGKLEQTAARVVVAKDVQQQILAEKFEATTGEYLGQFNGFKSKCTGCAMGAVLLSVFRKFDGRIEEHLKSKQKFFGSENSDPHMENFVDGYDIENAVEELFCPVQLRLMEAAFEGTEYYINGYERKMGYPWYDANPDPDDRLYAIMQNVIENNGSFLIDEVYIASDS